MMQHNWRRQLCCIIRRTERPLRAVTADRTWCGHGVFAHNLVKISTLAG
ncbi:MAG: hypothetical protein JOY55_25235 [Mycobacterium sp.]|nr:hypothetical protein [Mycobacterium sp.]MBV8295065.1 hypothetical protein [Mycobacterium sp.]